MARESQGFSRFSSLPVRMLTGALYGGVLLGTTLFGGELGLAILLSALGGIGVMELYRITRRGPRRLAELAGFASVVAMPLVTGFIGLNGLLLVVTLLVVGAFGMHVVSTGMRIADTAVVVLGALAVGFSLSHLVLVRGLEDGMILTLAVLISVWAGDVFAYLVGSLFGSHKLAPRISPHKSWEGFAAGVVGTCAVWVALPYITEVDARVGWLVTVGVVIAIAGLVGDLFESRIKREAGVKDSGQLLPGHGGMLDRIDSLLLVSVVAYHLLVVGGVQ